MSHRSSARSRCARRGLAAVEFAVLLPLLMYLFLIAVDWGRIFFGTLTIGGSARNGAIQAYDPVTAVESPYLTIDAAARADATNLPGSSINVTTTTSLDGSGNTNTTVNVAYGFGTVTHYPGIPAVTNTTRSIQVRQAPASPKF